MLKGIYLLNEHAYDVIYGPPEREAIANLVDIYAPPQTQESIRKNPAILREADVILSGWGMMKLDEIFLATAPNLKAIFYGAGTIRALVTEAFWRRNIIITSSYAANAVPVTEYTLSQILFSLKCGWQHERSCRSHETRTRFPVAGGYGSKVGLISLGAIARLVAQHLQNFDLHI